MATWGTLPMGPQAWPSVLQPYKDTGALDLIIVDFAVTAQEAAGSSWILGQKAQSSTQASV